MFNQGTVLLLSQEMISLQSNVKLRAVQNTNVVLCMVRCLQTSVVSRELSLLFLVQVFSCTYTSLIASLTAEQARRFNDPDSEYQVLVASDAIGMGLNLSIKRIIFNSMIKTNGEKLVRLLHTEVKQIAGWQIITLAFLLMFLAISHCSTLTLLFLLFLLNPNILLYPVYRTSWPEKLAIS